MSQPPPIDLVALVALLLGFVSSTQVSGQIAPYVLVVGVASFSAWMAAGDRDPDDEWPRWRTLRFIAQRTALAAFVAVGVSWGMQRVSGMDWRWTLPVVAVVVAYIDHRETIAWGWGRIKLMLGIGQPAAPPPGDKP
ncbi:MAG: hypothetical protein ACRCYZ_06820 [Alphaproteobacteria bacterium]